MLKNGNDLWFFDPASKASIRISPQQRLLGQAANGDVMTVNLAVDYNAQLAGEEEIQDGEKKIRSAYLLKLTAKNPEVTYHRIDYWVDRTNSRPIKAKFYSASDRLLKTAYYRKFDQQLGQERPTETVIIDGLDPQWVTVLRSSDFAFRDVPESWLQRDFLPRFKAE
jgi:outer membrane lipoprotein-sorting protein